MQTEPNVLVVVAHPDDETLWVGGTVVMHPEWRWTVISLCRRNDADRAPRFFRVLDRLGATGFIGDLDDGPDQAPLEEEDVACAIRSLLPSSLWDIVYTHSPFGEYTRHRRHEETARAIVALWSCGDLVTDEVRMFAYEDGDRGYLPRAIADADIVTQLADEVWNVKRDLVENVYGFARESWEARATPRVEAFWRFASPDRCSRWMLREQQPAERSSSSGGDVGSR